MFPGVGKDTAIMRQPSLEVVDFGLHPADGRLFTYRVAPRTPSRGHISWRWAHNEAVIVTKRVRPRSRPAAGVAQPLSCSARQLPAPPDVLVVFVRFVTSAPVTRVKKQEKLARTRCILVM